MLDTKNINPQTTSDPADIGKRLREVRKRRGLKQQQLAKELGIGVSALRLYEIGDRTAPIPVLVKICRFFNISADWLLGLPKQEDTEASKVIDELFKLAIIGNLATAARKAGVAMEPSLINGMRNASLKKINEIATAFPAFITAAVLARDIKEDEKNEL
ncbi:MAG: helix-turn-helix transcriptional regulator [Lachnospiraceae bacterium]|nr:helix-turn-helix transcriptional regulator [Lachnospiraceae bacterium]